MITMSTEYMPSSHLLFHPTPASPVAAVRNVNSPAPPKAKMNLHSSVMLTIRSLKYQILIIICSGKEYS